MFKQINKLFDYIRKWKYIETKYDPYHCFKLNSPTSSQKSLYEELERMYEWNYDNLRGEWDHISERTSKGKLCRAAEKYFFVFKRKTDAVAFKLQWGE